MLFSNFSDSIVNRVSFTLDMWNCILPLALLSSQAHVRAFYVPPLLRTDSASKTFNIRNLASAARRTCQICSLGPLRVSATRGNERVSNGGRASTTRSDVLDVAIVGAGPAGLALASK